MPEFKTIVIQTQVEPGYLAARACPVCGGHDHQRVYTLNHFQFFTDDAHKQASIHHVACRSCYALFMNPTYTPLGFSVLFAQAGASYGASELRQEEQLGWLDGHGLLAEGLTYLDVGCYTGKFIAGLPDRVAAIGVDIDGDAVAEAERRLGGPNRTFIQADFEALALETTPDVMTMFHVLEHLPRPIAVLAKLRLHAASHTRLVLEVPILELADTNDINGFLTVQHLTHFSQHTLAMVLALSGWRIEAETRQPDYNGYRVLASPTEPVERPPEPTDLTARYHYLAHFYGVLEQANRLLAQLPPADHWVIWGGGMHTELLFHLTTFFEPDRPCLIVDMDPKKQGGHWRGIPISPPDVLAEMDWRRTRLLISSYGNQELIAEAARARAVPDDRIHRIYAFLRRY